MSFLVPAKALWARSTALPTAQKRKGDTGIQKYGA